MPHMRFTLLAACFMCLGFSSCERHSWSKTKVLFEEHHAHGHASGNEHAQHAQNHDSQHGESPIDPAKQPANGAH